MIGKIGMGFVGLILAVLAVFIPSIPFEIINANVFTNKAAYGYVDVPGTKVLHLPAGAVNVEFAELVPGRSNQTPDVYWPSDLTLTVAPASGTGAAATLTKSLGTSTNESAYDTNAGIDFYNLQVPQAGRYLLTAKGSTDQNINAKFLLGYGPPISPLLIYGIVALVELIGGGIWLALKRRSGGTVSRPRFARGSLRGKIATPSEPEPVVMAPKRLNPPDAASHAKSHDGGCDPLDRLKKLADLHDRGVLTDDEFAAEKAKILAED